MELKVRIVKLDKRDAYYPIRHLLEGMIVEIEEQYMSDLEFSQEQCDFLQREIPDDFKFKKYFRNPKWINFIYHDGLYTKILNIKCNGCDNQVETSVCPHCGEWN